MDVYEVATKLIGPVRPVGETNIDNERFDNLKVMTELVDRLLKDIDDVASWKGRAEFSMNRAGKYADDFYTRIGIIE